MAVDQRNKLEHMAAGAALMLGMLVPASIYAFWDTYLFRDPRVYFPWEHIHAAPAAAWLLLLVAQAAAIASGRRSLHRRLGRLFWPLAPLVVVTTVIAAWDAFAPSSRGDFARYILADRAFLTLYFAGFTFAALRARKRPHLHARLMICGSVLLLDPILNRISDNFIDWRYVTGVHQWISYAAMDAIIGFLALRDARQGKQRVFLLALCLLILGQAAVLLGWDGAPWTAAASAFGSLSLEWIPGAGIDAP